MNNDKRLRVLYVEDNCDAFDMVKVMLDLSKIEVDCAETIGEALARARTETFDLYLLDSGFPDGNGLSLCRTLRAAYPGIPILFYSGNAHPDEIRMGMAAGADGYITKPHSDKLAGTIIQLVENRREQYFAGASLPQRAAPVSIRGT